MIEEQAKFDETVYSNTAGSWYAGAEHELLEAFDLAGKDDRDAYVGIGTEPRVVQSSQCGRYRDSPDVLGVLGHRATW